MSHSRTVLRPHALAYAKAYARARVDLAIMQLNWQAEVAELRAELAQCKRELVRLCELDAAARAERDFGELVH
jgi:hypothetical protein